jgi:hypothetical protein
MAHDVTYHDVFTALSLLEGRDESEAYKWESLVAILTGKGSMVDWDGNQALLKNDCASKRAE